MNIMIRLAGALLIAVFAWPIQAEVLLPAPRQLSAHVWAWIGPYDPPTRENRGFRMNLGFVVGSDAVAVIDSGYSPAMAESMLERIRELTPLPARYVVNTNSQPHRFLGNDVFRKAGARLIAGREAAERMARDGGMFAETAASILGTARQAVPAAPDLLLKLKDAIAVDLGAGVTLSIRHVGTTHTQGSLIVEVLPDRVLFAGDVLYGGRLPALLPDSSVKNWIAAYETLREANSTLFIPGHGQPGPLADFDHPTFLYLTRIKAHMDEAVKKGDDIEKAKVEFDASAWKTLANFNELSGRNAYQAYQESEAEGF